MNEIICATCDSYGCDRPDTTQYVTEDAAAPISDFVQWIPLKC